jgi:glucose uptake protein
VAAVWGVFVWKEFKDAPSSTTPLIAAMFLGYALGLLLIGRATL